MLRQILIRNFALVDKIEISFGPGLTVLTGETGAGKSIVVDAVSFLLGSRAEREMIRSGTTKASVEGVFGISSAPGIYDVLQENDLETDDGDELLIARELNLNGRSICRVAGTAVTLGYLKRITSQLMDIHGQHDHQALLDERTHRRFVDSFGDSGFQMLLGMVRAAHDRYQALDKAYSALLHKSVQRAERMELLGIQKKELERAAFAPGEEDQLVKSRDLLRHADRISNALQEAYNALYGGNRGEETAVGLIRAAATSLSGAESITEQYRHLRERLDAAYYEVEDIAQTLRHEVDGLADHQGMSLDKVEERLDLFRRLSRKYGATTEEMAATLDSIKKELTSFEQMDDSLEQLAAERDAALEDYRAKAGELSVQRSRVALALEGLIEKQFDFLSMKGTRLMIRLQQNAQAVTRDGIDQVSLLIAPNVGEPPKPLDKIASGGELSRIMLAIKSVSAQVTDIPAMVFDEIDAGISGYAAQAVAEKLWDIARYRQVICVTHLQQIAAMASSHLLVKKVEGSGRTHIETRLLHHDERVREISRLLGEVGSRSGSGTAHAQAMLDEAAAYRQNSAHRC